MKQFADKYKSFGLAALPVELDKGPKFVNEQKVIRLSWAGAIPDEAWTGAEGIGIICGERSGGLECIDFDNNFSDAKKTLTDFLSISEVKLIYESYKFPIQSTQSGGYHLLYRCEKNNGNQKLASRPKLDNSNKWKPVSLIEIRGEGGYFVAEPTLGYKVIRNSLEIINTITEKERETLLAFAKSFNEWNNSEINIPNESKDRPGDRYNQDEDSILKMKTILTEAGWKQIGTHGWRRPEKDIGISATLGKVAPNIFYNFSSNSFPLEPNKAYTPFQILALLKYKGNFSECVRNLPEKYKTLQPPAVQTARQKAEQADRLKSLLEKAQINPDLQIDKPPVIFAIQNKPTNYANRVFTLGNFSVITGKSKAKKTFLITMIASALSINGEQFGLFVGSLPEGKRKILFFDTEQSFYDSWKTSQNIKRLIGNTDNIVFYTLREYSPLERCEIIDYAISNCPDLGIVFIDGIADLALAINDEIEASRVVGLLMKWTKVFNIHICNLIHQNKNDNFATGHLGSSAIKKAEVVIGAKKDKDDKRISVIECDMIRGARDFEPFCIEINEEGLPQIVGEQEQKEGKKLFDYTESAYKQEEEILPF